MEKRRNKLFAIYLYWSFSGEGKVIGGMSTLETWLMEVFGELLGEKEEESREKRLEEWDSREEG